MATLEERVAALEQYRKDREAQQITSPLDEKSRVILNEYFLSVNRAFLFTNPSGMDFVYFIAQQANKTVVMSGQNNLIGYIANTNDFLNAGMNVVTGQQITDMPNDTQVILWTTGATPGGLSTGGALYYVVQSTGPTFKLSLTIGGSAIDITDVGEGEQFLEIVG